MNDADCKNSPSAMSFGSVISIAISIAAAISLNGCAMGGNATAYGNGNATGGSVTISGRSDIDVVHEAPDPFIRPGISNQSQGSRAQLQEAIDKAQRAVAEAEDKVNSPPPAKSAESAPASSNLKP